MSARSPLRLDLGARFVDHPRRWQAFQGGGSCRGSSQTGLDYSCNFADWRAQLMTASIPTAAGQRVAGVGDADLCQLYAYTRRYGCTRSVLLYPFVPGLEPREFGVHDADGSFSGERLSVRHVQLHRNLQQEGQRQALTDDLEAILREGPDMPAADRVAAGGAA